MTKELIEKYYSNNCSEAEKQEIKQFFEDHPEEIEQYFDESEWENFEELLVEPNEFTDHFLHKLGTQLPEARIRRIRILRTIAIVASICFALGLSTYFLTTYIHKPNIAVRNTMLQKVSPYTILTNKGHTVKSFKLPDRSEVRLSPGGSIKFLTALKGDRRDIYLTGECVFKVQKDASRPFTVYCREVATTALGTIFKVTEQNSNTKVAIALIEGKILVRSTDKKSADGKDYYLLPGNKIAYSRVDKQFSIIEQGSQNDHKDERARKLNADIAKVENKYKSSKTTSIITAITESNNGIQFNDVSLARVLDVLAEKRGVKISYPTNRVDNIKFIGTVNDRMTTEKVLSDIAAMNDLILIKDTINNKFIFQ